MSFLDNLVVLSSQLNGYLSKLAGTVTVGNRVAVDLGGASLTGSFSSDIPDNTGTGTLSALNSTVSVATEGRAHAGFAIGSGFTGVLTFEVSFDSGTPVTWAAVQSLSIGTEPPTYATTLTVAGSAAGCGILVPPGATNVRARVSTATSGTASATIRSTVAGDLYTFPQLDSIITALAGTLTVGLPSGASTAANQSAGNTSLAAIVTALAGTLTVGLPSGASTSANQTSTNTKLDTLHTDVGPASTVYDGNKNVTTAGTRVALAASQALTRGVRVRAKDANTGLIYIGGSSVSSSSDRLAPGEPTWMDINNLANVYIDAAVSGEGVTFSGW